jgi:tRNA(adenine34) deaminase
MLAMAIARLRASVVCVDDGALLCVQLRDPRTHVARLFAPGGAVEMGETPAAAAMRETREETGHEVAIDLASEHVVRYPFTWADVKVACTTHFFRAHLRGSRADAADVNDATYNEGVVWLPLERVNTELGFDPAILAAVQHLLGLADTHP